MEEFHRTGISTVLTADTEVQVRAGFTAHLRGHLYQFADTDLVDTRKRITLIDLVLIVGGQELACVVTAEAKGHLGQVIGAEGEELSFRCNLICGQCSTRSLNHGADQILEVDAGCGNQLIGSGNHDILYELELLDFTHQRDHDFGNQIPVGMTALDGKSGLDDGTGLHLGNLRIGNSQTAAAVTHHGVELMQLIDHHLDLFNGLAFGFGEGCNVLFFRRDKLVQRGIQEADGNRIALHGLIDTLKVFLLHRLELVQSCDTLFFGVCADHLTEGSDAVSIEEHMLGTGQADAVSTQLNCLGSVTRVVGVGTDFQAAILVSPAHDTAKLTGDGRIDGRNDTVIDITGRTVDGDAVTLMIGLAGQRELLGFLVHVDLTAAGDTALAHAAGNNRRVAGHSAANRQDPLCGSHTLDIFGAGLKANQDNLFLPGGPGLGIFRREDDPAAGGTGRGAEALSDRGSGLQLIRIKLRVQQGVEIARLNHQNGLLLVDHTFVDKVAGDLQCGLRGALAVAALEHIKLAVLDGELHVLHVAVVALEQGANLDELGVGLRELIRHLSDGHRSADPGDDIFTLGIGEELAHELLLTGGGITRKGNAGTGVLVQVAEDHRHDVYGSAPGIGDIVLLSVVVGARIVPGTEHGTDGFLQLDDGVGGEVFADLLFVLGLELFCQFLQVCSS